MSGTSGNWLQPDDHEHVDVYLHEGQPTIIFLGGEDLNDQANFKYAIQGTNTWKHEDDLEPSDVRQLIVDEPDEVAGKSWDLEFTAAEKTVLLLHGVEFEQ